MFKPLYYRRYLDDTIGVLTTKDQYNNFYNHINGYLPCEHVFTVEERNEKLSFLDVLLVKGDLSGFLCLPQDN